LQSPIGEIQARRGLRLVFSFIVAMLETALKSTPTASPTKPGMLQDKEIHDFDGEVWSKVYKLINESIVRDDDSDDNAIDVSRYNTKATGHWQA